MTDPDTTAPRWRRAETTRRRRRARNLGHPPPRGYVMLLADETIAPDTSVLEPTAGWGYPNTDELGQPVGDALMCAPA